jgi:anaerobic selenocysteine-containing dehydrogenase
MDMSRIGAVLCGDPEELQGGPPVTAMLIQNVNPLDVAPDTNKVRRGFAREDLFVCVHEQFMTPTALQADLVLPATMFLEHDDVYQAGGHSHIQIGRKLIAPPGEARSNHSLICDLAHRLGATHRGFGMSEMEVIDETLRASGWPEAREVIDRRWVDAQPSFEESHFLNGFGHPDKRFRFKPDWAGIGRLGHVMTPMPDHLDRIENPTEAHPFRLITSPARQFLNTSFTETPGSRKREGRPTALLNAEDAARLGASTGARLRLFNNRGAVVVHAEIAQGQLPGTVVVEGIWPSEYFETGIGINALTSDEPAPPLGGAVFHDTAISLEVLEASAQMPLAAE